MGAVGNFLSKYIERIKANPELLFPWLIGIIGFTIPIVQAVVHEFNSLSFYAALFFTAVALIIYQILNCNIRIGEKLSNIEHERKLKDKLVMKEISPEEFEQTMALLKKYPYESAEQK